MLICNNVHIFNIPLGNFECNYFKFTWSEGIVLRTVLHMGFNIFPSLSVSLMLSNDIEYTSFLGQVFISEIFFFFNWVTVGINIMGMVMGIQHSSGRSKYWILKRNLNPGTSQKNAITVYT